MFFNYIYIKGSWLSELQQLCSEGNLGLSQFKSTIDFRAAINEESTVLLPHTFDFWKDISHNYLVEEFFCYSLYCC